MDETNQGPSADVTQAVADSNAADGASLPASLSGTAANAGAVPVAVPPDPLSTSSSAAQSAPAGGPIHDALAGEGSCDGTLPASGPVGSDGGGGIVAITEAGGAGTGELSGVPVADVSTPANVTVNQAALPSPISNGETLASADAPAVVPPETLLARLHADLEALERKIELGIHVFAHEVAAIRDQVKALI
ncbi:hypothetical protein QZM99_06035 [Burkholderia gladioli]|uniref:hypothetical protein n=1 Tax=Burkholderia gladioli TaxID=28095 RepID=UPI00163F078F|nr:hypothetical protein [Burkholderia gladioli]MDN7917647.1 hypothetical protein [Burkholderia gladioli]